MNRLRLLAQGSWLILVALLLISCGVSPVTEGQVAKLTSEVPRISPEELKDRLDNGEAILIVDSRPTSSFETQHIAGAISVPIDEVESRLDEFPRDQEIVFYCT